MTDNINPQVQVETEPQTQIQPEKPPILKKFPGTKEKVKGNVFIVMGSILIVLLGIATGWFLSGNKLGKGTSTKGESGTVSSQKSSNEEGVLDESVKYQEAEGTLVEGGIKGEGTYHLERDGGPSKYVYLTSTAIGLDKFVGKKVKVWGETLSAINAPWLMDVSKIKLIE